MHDCVMRTIALGFALALSACVSAGEVAYQDDEEPGDVARGQALVEARCSGCHAVGAVGESPYPAAPPLRTLHMKYDVEGLAEAFAEGILVGHRGAQQMPEFVLTPEEIDDLIAYLKSFE